MEYNHKQKEVLLGLARSELRRQEIRQQLQDLDSTVMDSFKRFSQAKRSMSKKERDAIWRDMDDWQALCRRFVSCNQRN